MDRRGPEVRPRPGDRPPTGCLRPEWDEGIQRQLSGVRQRVEPGPQVRVWGARTRTGRDSWPPQAPTGAGRPPAPGHAPRGPGPPAAAPGVRPPQAAERGPGPAAPLRAEVGGGARRPPAPLPPRLPGRLVGRSPGLGPPRTGLVGSRRFHCPAREWELEAEVRLPVHEGVQLSAPEYRSRLYQVLRARPPPPAPSARAARAAPGGPLSASLPQMILERRARRLPGEKGQGDAPLQAPGAELLASRPQARALHPRAAPPPPAQDRGHRPQNSPAHGACCERRTPVWGPLVRAQTPHPGLTSDPQTPPAEPRASAGTTRHPRSSLRPREAGAAGTGSPGRRRSPPRG